MPFLYLIEAVDDAFFWIKILNSVLISYDWIGNHIQYVLLTWLISQLNPATASSKCIYEDVTLKRCNKIKMVTRHVISRNIISEQNLQYLFIMNCSRCYYLDSQLNTPYIREKWFEKYTYRRTSNVSQRNTVASSILHFTSQRN